MTRTTTKQSETVELAQDSLIVAQKRADSLGMSFSEYVQSLIDKDADIEVKDPWREPVPTHVAKQWEQDIAEFEEEDKKGLQPSFSTAQELVDDLES
jgi:hypothetical protein